ncbi:uncharacterized protein ACNLHF_001110 isoform 2-T2 [Anomaloglossus baeobatrachus]
MRPCSREEGRFSPLRTAAPHSYACLEKDEYCQDGAGERPQSPLQCIQANDSIRTETNKKVVKMKSKRYRKCRCGGLFSPRSIIPLLRPASVPWSQLHINPMFGDAIAAQWVSTEINLS